MTWRVDDTDGYFLDLNRSFWSHKGPFDPYKGQYYRPFDQRFHLIINVAVSGTFFADSSTFDAASDSKTWTSHLTVDYVRVYQDDSIIVPSPISTPTPFLPTPTRPFPVPTPTFIPIDPEKPWHEPLIVVLIGIVAFEFLIILGLIWSLRQASQDSVEPEEPVKQDEEIVRMLEEY